eukprot:TRINITY_DN81738_c0_g1_i1.p1 TRINITY_DN81738_c0_g1~~TRINITY_DN81738_c0_g1_i1.p1  ORF type:complete len:153 (-),score=19.50 TRINITY_DN81738_c0_g1_i1:145-603(-)
MGRDSDSRDAQDSEVGFRSLPAERIDEEDCLCGCCASCCRLLRKAFLDDRGRKVIFVTGFLLLVAVAFFREPLAELLGKLLKVVEYILRPLLFVEDVVPKPVLFMTIFVSISGTLCYLCYKNWQVATAVGICIFVAAGYEVLCATLWSNPLH